MATTLRLEIVTPAGRVYAEDVEMVTLPGVAGQMGIYPHHVPLMTQMVPGEMIVSNAAMICITARAKDPTTSPPRRWASRSLPHISPTTFTNRKPTPPG